MNILVLGSEGFIGQNLIKYYAGQKHRVAGCDLIQAEVTHYHYHRISLLSPEFGVLFRSQVFDVCINAAGSGNVGYSVAQPLSDFEANTSAVAFVLDCIRKNNPACLYFHISSAAVYGNPQQLPIKETDHCNPLSPYGWHKMMSESLCKEYTKLFGLKTVIVRPFSVYGPGLRKQLFWDIYHKWLNTKEPTIELWGLGSETRDFIFISDLIMGMDLVLRNGGRSGDIYNLASGLESCIGDIAPLLLSFLDQKVSVKFNQQSRIGDPLHWRADISKLQSLGFTTQIGIEDGIKELAEWLKNLN